MKINIYKKCLLQQEVIEQITVACYKAYKKGVNPLPCLRKRFEVKFRFVHCDGWDMPYYQPFPGFSGFIVGKKENHDGYTDTVQIGFCIDGYYQDIITIK